MSSQQQRRKEGLFSPALSQARRADSLQSGTALPRLASGGGGSSKRFGLAESGGARAVPQLVQPPKSPWASPPSPQLPQMASTAESIKAIRASSTVGLAPRTAAPPWPDAPAMLTSCQALSGPEAAAAAAREGLSGGGGERQIQLLTKALEESRAQVRALTQERSRASERVVQILEAISASEPTGTQAGEVDAGSLVVSGGPGPGADEAEQLLDKLDARVRQLHESLQIREVEVAESRLRHEEAATQVVAREQELEGKERLVEGLRQSVHLLEEAQHALQVKVGMLEGQAADQAATARRRMEEQTQSLKGEAATARAYQERCANAERELEGCRAALHEARESNAELRAQCDRMRAQLAETQAKQVASERKLWEATSARGELEGEHRALLERNRALLEANRGLQGALADHKERALQADALKQALEVQRTAGEQLAAGLRAEAGGLAEELQQEREQRLQGEQALREALAEVQSLRAANQGKADELASLLLKLDEYSDKVVQLGDEAASAAKQAAAVLEQKQRAEQQVEAARRESRSLRDSLADLAVAEKRLELQLEETQARLSCCEAELKQAQFQKQQLSLEGERKEEHIRMMQATLAEQAVQVKALAEARAQCCQQQESLRALQAQLGEAGERCGQLRQSLLELTAAKEEADKAAYKLGIINGHLREQQATLTTKLKSEQAELSNARSVIEELRAQAEAERQAFQAELSAREGEYERTNARNVDLEHLSMQQSALIGNLEGQRASLSKQLDSTQQRCCRLQRLGTAYSHAYARLVAHAPELHTQFARQLGSLLHLCRHVVLHLDAARAAACPVTQDEATHASPAGQVCEAHGVADAGDVRAQSAAGEVLAQPATSGQWDGQLGKVLDVLHVELGIAVQLLDAQSGSAEVAMLATVPTNIAAALESDLAGSEQPAAELVADVRSGSSGGSGSGTGGGSGGSTCEWQQSSQGTAAMATGTASSCQEDAVQLGNDGEKELREFCAGAAQVAQMESQLDRLMHENVALASKAQAAAGLHERELAARQRAQEVVSRLRAELQATKAERDAFKGQRDLHEGLSRDLARKLREAAYTVRQLEAEAEGPILSMAHRGLLDRAVQTQHCELWLRNVGAPGVGAATGGLGGSCACASSAMEAPALEGVGSQPAAGLSAPGGEPAAFEVALPAADAERLVRDIYRAKAVQDIATARGEKPFVPLPVFAETFFQLQHGADSVVATQRLQQLAASVHQAASSGSEADQRNRELVLFGLAAGLLKEEEVEALQASPAQAAQQPLPGDVPPEVTQRDGPLAQGHPPTSWPSTEPAERVPLALYRSRRPCSSAARDAERASLRTFALSAWHAAYLRSAARQAPTPAADPLRLLDGLGILRDLWDLMLSVPGVGELLQWVAGGGAGCCLGALGCLGALDLGMPVAENQVPQLYLLLVDACRLLGIATTPRLFIHNSNEAAAYYMQVPAQPAAFHALNGSLVPAAQQQQQQPRQPSNRGRSGGVTQQAGPSGPSEAAAAAGPPGVTQWDCMIVLSSALVDLLEPSELQAVMAGCLGFHAALTCTAPNSLPAMLPALGTQRPGSNGSGSSVEQQRALCRALSGMHTLGSLCALCPEAVARQLPPQLLPLFSPRVQPVLLRALRYLALYGDRFSLAAAGDVRVVASALVKQASGSAALRDELNLDAMLQQARALDAAAGQMLPALLSQEGGPAVVAASSSLAVLRIQQLCSFARALQS